MESLGGLLQQLNPSFREQSRRIAAELMDDPYVREFRAGHPELKDAQLMTDLSKLYQYARDSKTVRIVRGWITVLTISRVTFANWK